MATVLRAKMLSRFTCLGDKCPDTCCKGWSMQLDEPTLTRYREEKPELLDAVEPGEGDAAWIMRKDKVTGHCVKLEDGWCGIYKAFGDKFLGDACHFYPRATRALDAQPVMTAAPSCPEIVRLALEDDDAFAFEKIEVERLPHSLKNYLPDGMSADEALAVHQAFLDACRDEASAEKIFARIASVSRSIELIDRKSWSQAVPFYLKHADTRLPKSEAALADPFNLLHALSGLIVASKKIMSPRLQQTVSEMERALQVTLDWEQVLIHTTHASEGAYQKMLAQWNETLSAIYQPILKRWLMMQLSLAFFPFAGLGANLDERITLIGVRLATLKLALMSAHVIQNGAMPPEEVVRVIQSLSRFLDHLGDPSFSLQIYKETGWAREARMLGLLTL